MIAFKVDGLKGLEQALADLPKRVSRRSFLIDALTEGGEPMRQAIGRHAPRRAPAPDIADNIVISESRKTEDQAAVAIGPQRGFAYGLPLELGTVHMAAHPFARPGFDETVESVPAKVGDVMWRELAGRGISRPTEIADDADVEDLGLTRKQATTAAAFTGKQRAPR